MKFRDLFGQIFSFVAPSPAALPILVPEVTPDTELVQVFKRAIYLIEKCGWVQGRGLGMNGELCAGHALHLAAIYVNPVLSSMLSHQAWSAVKGYVSRDSVAEWNDSPFRTKSGVLAVLKELTKIYSQ